MRALPMIVLAALALGCMLVEKEEAVAKPGSKGAAPQAPTAIPAAVDREWAVFELGGGPVPARGPTIAFRDGRVHGFAGCNRYTGPVTFTGTNGLKVGAAAMTMMACPDPQMEVEERFAKALEGVVRWEVRDGVLALMGADGRAVVRARPAPPAS